MGKQREKWPCAVLTRSVAFIILAKSITFTKNVIVFVNNGKTREGN